MTLMTGITSTQVNSFASYDRMGFVQAVRNGAPLFLCAAVYNGQDSVNFGHNV